jgi:hypothetical protein
MSELAWHPSKIYLNANTAWHRWLAGIRMPLSEPRAETEMSAVTNPGGPLPALALVQGLVLGAMALPTPASADLPTPMSGLSPMGARIRASTLA